MLRSVHLRGRHVQWERDRSRASSSFTSGTRSNCCWYYADQPKSTGDCSGQRLLYASQWPRLLVHPVFGYLRAHRHVNDLIQRVHVRHWLVHIYVKHLITLVLHGFWFWSGEPHRYMLDKLCTVTANRAGRDVREMLASRARRPQVPARRVPTIPERAQHLRCPLPGRPAAHVQVCESVSTASDLVLSDDRYDVTIDKHLQVRSLFPIDPL